MTDLTDEQRARALELRNVWADALGASTAAALPYHQSTAWLVMEDHVLKSHTPVKSDTGIDVEEVEVKEQPRRVHMLELVKEALDIVNGPRQDTYGNPADSFQQIADFWEAYLKRRAPGPITPKDVSRMMQLMKISRGATGVEHKDNLIDKIGYILLEAVI